jgi:hypothetical protein
MANGWRADSYIPQFTDEEQKVVDKAALRLAQASGYGSAWAPRVIHHSQEAMAASGISKAEVLNIAHRGRVMEQAARRGKWAKTHVRRQYEWAIHGGVVAQPCSVPDPETYSAFCIARLTGRERNLLLAFSLERIECWYLVEPSLMSYAHLTHVMAARDAMARVMYKVGKLSIKDRAKQLGMRKGEYQLQTRRAEWALRAWLVTAANKYNAAMKGYHATRFGSSDGNAMRRPRHFVGTWKSKRCQSVEGRPPAQVLSLQGQLAADHCSHFPAQTSNQDQAQRIASLLPAARIDALADTYNPAGITARLTAPLADIHSDRYVIDFDAAA